MKRTFGVAGHFALPGPIPGSAEFAGFDGWVKNHWLLKNAGICGQDEQNSVSKGPIGSDSATLGPASYVWDER